MDKSDICFTVTSGPYYGQVSHCILWTDGRVRVHASLGRMVSYCVIRTVVAVHIHLVLQLSLPLPLPLPLTLTLIAVTSSCSFTRQVPLSLIDIWNIDAIDEPEVERTGPGKIKDRGWR